MGGSVAYGLLLFLLKSYCVIEVSTITMCEWFLCTIAGSLFPDVDVKSKGQKYFYYFVLMILILLLINQKHTLFVCCSLVSITPMLVRHRGIFHQLRFIVATSSVLWLFLSALWPTIAYHIFCDLIFFNAGAASHIMLDYRCINIFRSKRYRRK